MRGLGCNVGAVVSERIEAIIGDILLKEGGYVDHPADRGGATKWGITQLTLSKWRHRDVTKDEVRALDEEEAKDIYRARYIIDPGFGALPENLMALVVDCAVNHGVTRAGLWLQKALGVKEDGVVGPKTQEAAAAADEGRVYRSVLASRARAYGRIVTDNPKQAVFAAGWANRLATFIESTP